MQQCAECGRNDSSIGFRNWYYELRSSDSRRGAAIKEVLLKDRLKGCMEIHMHAEAFSDS